MPTGAVIAVVGLRINTETNGDGPVNVLLGPATYNDTTSNQSVVSTVAPAGMALNTRIIYSSAQTSLVNSMRFPVTAGDAYKFSVPMQAAYGSANNGYVALIFMNSTGNEITRVALPFQPGQQQLLLSGPTNQEGQFTVQIPASTPVPSIVQFTYAGDSNHRLSSYMSQSSCMPSTCTATQCASTVGVDDCGNPCTTATAGTC